MRFDVTFGLESPRIAACVVSLVLFGLHSWSVPNITWQPYIKLQNK